MAAFTPPGLPGQRPFPAAFVTVTSHAGILGDFRLAESENVGRVPTNLSRRQRKRTLIGCDIGNGRTVVKLTRGKAEIG